jgi:hypothetical protein
MFWFPRDCPRGCIWPTPATTPQDRERFFGQSAATWIHVMEAGWLSRIEACRLYAYRLPAEMFRAHEVGGYWVTGGPVEEIEQMVVDDLAGRHAATRIELRITPSIWPFWRQVAASTVEFSGLRLGNSARIGIGSGSAPAGLAVFRGVRGWRGARSTAPRAVVGVPTHTSETSAPSTALR